MILHDIINAIVSQLFHSMASRFLLGFSYDIVRVELVSSTFALLFTEISLVTNTEISVASLSTEISVTLTTEIFVKSSANVDETS